MPSGNQSFNSTELTKTSQNKPYVSMHFSIQEQLVKLMAKYQLIFENFKGHLQIGSNEEHTQPEVMFRKVQDS